MSNPLVSIIVPMYNVEKYIERCIESVKAQTYAEWECICVDDCTPDKSVEIAEEIIYGDKRFTILHHDKNSGLSAARNTGTKAAKGEYIYYLDSDDELTPICIESLVNLAVKYPQAEIIQGCTRSIPEEDDDWRDINNKIDYPDFTEDKDWIVRHVFALDNFIPVNAWNKLIKKEWIDAAGDKLLFVEGIIHEDDRWILDVAKRISAIAFSKHVGYLHYCTEGSIMTSETISHVKRLYSKIQIIDDSSRYMDVKCKECFVIYMVYDSIDSYLMINLDSEDNNYLHQYRKRLWRLLFISMRLRLGYVVWTLLITLLCPLRLAKGIRYIRRVNMKRMIAYQEQF